MVKKELTHLGMCLKICAETNTPVGSDMFRQAILENPDHFPEEYARMKAWEAIPQEVHNAYRRDWEIMYAELHKDEPDSDGIFGIMENTEKSRIWQAWWGKTYPIEREKEAKLHKKHYSKYGV